MWERGGGSKATAFGILSHRLFFFLDPFPILFPSTVIQAQADARGGTEMYELMYVTALVRPNKIAKIQIFFN